MAFAFGLHPLWRAVTLITQLTFSTRIAVRRGKTRVWTYASPSMLITTLLDMSWCIFFSPARQAQARTALFDPRSSVGISLWHPRSSLKWTFKRASGITFSVAPPIASPAPSAFCWCHRQARALSSYSVAEPSRKLVKFLALDLAEPSCLPRQRVGLPSKVSFSVVRVCVWNFACLHHHLFSRLIVVHFKYFNSLSRKHRWHSQRSAGQPAASCREEIKWRERSARHG